MSKIQGNSFLPTEVSYELSKLVNQMCVEDRFVQIWLPL